jgi:methyl-accepting chemotaxis protein
MTEISVKAKLWSLIAIMLLLIISVGAVGFVTLDKGAATLRKLIEEDDAFQNLTNNLHLKLIQLRRFEKDYFLNIGNADRQQQYLKKYQEIAATVPQLMKQLADLAQADADLSDALKAKVAALSSHYANYQEGFKATVQRLQADPSLTPQQANALMETYKGNIPIMEEDMAAVAEAGDKMMHQVSAQAIRRGQDARTFIVVASLAALVLAGILGTALSRSIYRAIFREGLRRVAGRI